MSKSCERHTWQVIQTVMGEVLLKSSKCSCYLENSDPYFVSWIGSCSLCRETKQQQWQHCIELKVDNLWSMLYDLQAPSEVNPLLFTIATLTGHVIRAFGPDYSVSSHCNTIFATWCYASAAFAVLWCPSLSVTLVNFVKMSNRILKFFSRSGSHTILVFPYQTLWQYSDGAPVMGCWMPSAVGESDS